MWGVIVQIDYCAPQLNRIQAIEAQASKPSFHKELEEFWARTDRVNNSIDIHIHKKTGLTYIFFM